MRRAHDRELLQGKDNSGAYRMQTFRHGDTLPAGSIICGTDMNFPLVGPPYASVRAWVPVKEEPK